MQSKQLKRTRHGVTVLVMFAGALSMSSAMSYEQPDYEVVYSDGDTEYRQYMPYLVSETVIEAADNYRAAGNEGFRRLFRYITGANESRSDIAMTAPVQQAPAKGEKIAMTVPVQQGATEAGWTVSFMLPKQYTLATAPQPTDPRVYVREVPGRLMAVNRFSGRWSEANFVREERELLASLAAVNVSAIGQVERAAYNGPFTLPFLRRNEVMVAVDSLPVGISDDILSISI